MQKKKILLITQSRELLRAMPFLFFRAGFEVDVIAVGWVHKTKYISSCEILSDRSHLLPKLSEIDLTNYDIVTICDDQTLRDVLRSNLPIEKKLKLLPVKSDKDLEHLGSKIKLSQILFEHQISTPKFIVTNDFNQAVEAAKNIGYPLLVKVDYSGGGAGVFECKNLSDLQSLNPKIFDLPLLIQQKISGPEMDLSPFYRDGKLVDLDYAKVEETITKFGPSRLRTYEQLGCIDESIFLQVKKICEVLGANGFVNMSAIKCAESGKLYFFEADMRPTAWVDFGRFIGSDRAVKISNWIHSGETLESLPAINENYPLKLLSPLFIRMPFLEILCNCHGVWKFTSRDEIIWMAAKYLRKIQDLLWQINRIPTLTIRVFLPEKEDRQRLKFYFRNFTIFSDNNLANSTLEIFPKD